MTDWQLLRQYVDGASQQAFGELAARYAGLVYAAARRLVGDRHLAEDVTQAVFLILCRKASGLSRRTVLAAWLHQTTRYAAADALKLQARRRHHEQEAAKMRSCTEQHEAAWAQIAGDLDEAVAGLRRGEREAIVLRFLQNLSMNDVAQTLAISEDAAKKRVSRGLETLRGFFRGRGHLLSATGAASLLAAHAAEAAPVSLVSSISAGVAATGTTTAMAAGIAKGAMSMMAWAKAKLVGGVVVAVTMLAGTGGLVLKEVVAQEATRGAAPVVAAQTAAAQPAAATRAAGSAEAAAKAFLEAWAGGRDKEAEGLFAWRIANLPLMLAMERKSLDVRDVRIERSLRGKDGAMAVSSAMPNRQGGPKVLLLGLVIAEDGWLVTSFQFCDGQMAAKEIAEFQRKAPTSQLASVPLATQPVHRAYAALVTNTVHWRSSLTYSAIEHGLGLEIEAWADLKGRRLRQQITQSTTSPGVQANAHRRTEVYDGKRYLGASHEQRDYALRSLTPAEALSIVRRDPIPGANWDGILPANRLLAFAGQECLGQRLCDVWKGEIRGRPGRLSTFWVDAGSGELIKATEAGPKGYQMTLEVLERNVPLAEDLFSAEPPAGYDNQEPDSGKRLKPWHRMPDEKEAGFQTFSLGEGTQIHAWNSESRESPWTVEMFKHLKFGDELAGIPDGMTAVKSWNLPENISFQTRHLAYTVHDGRVLEWTLHVPVRPLPEDWPCQLIFSYGKGRHEQGVTSRWEPGLSREDFELLVRGMMADYNGGKAPEEVTYERVMGLMRELRPKDEEGGASVPGAQTEPGR